MHWHQWTSLDFVFAAIILTSTAFALIKGLAREVISLVALIGGLILAAFLYRTVGRWLLDLAKTEAVANLVAFIGIFVACLLIGAIAAFVVNRFIKKSSLEWVDRLMGGIFGFLRGWAVASILALALIAFPARQEILARSVFAPFLFAGARAAVWVVPQELKLKFYDEYHKILQTWNHDRSPV